jgi:hypothetical protein
LLIKTLTAQQLLKIEKQLNKNKNSCLVKISCGGYKRLKFEFIKNSGNWVLTKIKILRYRFGRWFVIGVIAVSIFFSLDQAISSNHFTDLSNTSGQTCVLSSSSTHQMTVPNKSPLRKKEALCHLAHSLSSLRGGDPLPGADGFKPISPYGRPRVNKSPTSPSLSTPKGKSLPGRIWTGLAARLNIGNDGGNCSKPKSEKPITKEERRNLYTKDSSVFKISNGDSNVVHPGQTGFKTKKHGKIAGLKTKDNQKTPSTKENKKLFHDYVVNGSQRLGADPNAIYPNVQYTTKNQPTQLVTVLFDETTKECYLFKAKVDEKGNHPWVTLMKLDKTQSEDLQNNNSIGSEYKKLHKEKNDEEK